MKTFILSEEEKKEILIKHIIMGYKTNNVLVEKKIEVVEKIRAGSAGILDGIDDLASLRTVNSNLANSIDEVVKNSLTASKENLNFIPDAAKKTKVIIKTADDLFDALKNGKFASTLDATRFQQGLLKTTTIDKGLAQIIAPNIIKTKFINEFSHITTVGDLKKALSKRGYSPNAVDEIVKAAQDNTKFMNASHLPKGGKKGPGGSGGSGGKKPVDQTDITPISKTKWFQYAKRAAIGGGVIFTLGYLFNLWLKSKGTADDLPPCVKETVPNVNTDPTIFERFLDTGYVLYDITPSKYRIYYNKKFELVDVGNQRVLKKGTWVFENNKLILTQDDGYVVTRPCGESPEPSPQRFCPTYRYTNGPEFKVCSFSPSEDLIKKVQGCLARRNNSPLVSDGYFGQKTQTALNTLFPDKKFNDKFTTNDIPEICGESRLGPEYQQDDMMDPDQIEAAKKAEQQAKLRSGTGNQEIPDGPDIYRDATANPQSGNPQTNKQKPIMNKGFNMSGVERPYNQYLNQ